MLKICPSNNSLKNLAHHFIFILVPTLERHWHAFDSALGKHPHLICYAVKANSNIGILNVMAKLGLSVLISFRKAEFRTAY